LQFFCFFVFVFRFGQNGFLYYLFYSVGSLLCVVLGRFLWSLHFFFEEMTAEKNCFMSYKKKKCLRAEFFLVLCCLKKSSGSRILLYFHLACIVVVFCGFNQTKREKDRLALVLSLFGCFFVFF
jgi:asparagine N-glycosylation enzyme membrane subunit Stt3